MPRFGHFNREHSPNAKTAISQWCEHEMKLFFDIPSWFLLTVGGNQKKTRLFARKCKLLRNKKSGEASNFSGCTTINGENPKITIFQGPEEKSKLFFYFPSYFILNV